MGGPGGEWGEARSVEWARRAWGNRTVYGGGGREVKEVKEVKEIKEVKEKKLLVGWMAREVPLTEVQGVDTVDGEKCALLGWNFEKRAGSMRVCERR